MWLSWGFTSGLHECTTRPDCPQQEGWIYAVYIAIIKHGAAQESFRGCPHRGTKPGQAQLCTGLAAMQHPAAVVNARRRHSLRTSPSVLLQCCAKTGVPAAGQTRHCCAQWRAGARTGFGPSCAAQSPGTADTPASHPSRRTRLHSHRPRIDNAITACKAEDVCGYCANFIILQSTRWHLSKALS